MEAVFDTLAVAGRRLRFGVTESEPTAEANALLGGIVAVLGALFVWDVYVQLRQHVLFLRRSPPKELVRAVKAIDDGDDHGPGEGVPSEHASKPVLDWMDIGESSVLASARERLAGEQAAGEDEEGGDDGIEAASGGPRTSGKRAAGAEPAFRAKLAKRFGRAQAYGLDRSRLAFFRMAFSTSVTLASIAGGLMPAAWGAGSRAVASVWAPSWLGPLDGMAGDAARAVAFMAVTGIVDTVLGCPLELYATFVVERRHGFNRQSIGLWACDQAKGAVLAAVVGGPLVAGLAVLLAWGGAWLPLWLWLAMSTFSIALNLAYPSLIQPLFNTFEQLPPGAPRDVLEGIARSVGFPSTNLVVVDGTTRSSHSNAYVIGFGPVKRITVFDSLLAHTTLDEARAVIAHELGHWKLAHTPLLLVASLAQTAALFGLYGAVASYDGLSQAAGFAPAAAPPIVRLSLFLSLGLAPLGPLLQAAVSAFTRTLEYQADAFAVDLGEAGPLSRALAKLAIENLSTPWVDPLYAACHFSHPALVERLSAIASRDAARAKRAA